MENQAVQLARMLRDQGIEVSFITGFYVEDYLKRRHPGIRWRDTIENIPVYRVPVTRIAWRLRLISYALFAFGLLTVGLGQFQIIHAHQLVSTGIAGAIIGKLLRRPAIVKIASGGHVGDLVALRRAFFGHPPIGFLSKQLDCIVCLTSQIRSELLEAGFPAEKLVLIPNGVDTTRFYPVSDEDKLRLRDKLGIPNQERVAVFVGGLKPKKRVGFLLSAWNLVQKENARVRLLLIGDGPLRPILEEQYRSMGLEKTVSFVGAVDNVDEYLRASDLFVLPSLGEGLSNALLEAMATGLAVITTDTQGNRDVIRHQENGLLFSPEDVRGLAEYIAGVLNDKVRARHLGRKALSTVEARFSLNLVVKQYVHLYTSLERGERIPCEMRP